jgi:acrylyl-CoA reductase (NADPH)
MAVGTAGMAAALAVMALECHGCRPGEGEVVVTGATGGVGGLSIALLSALGYDVVACTGRLELSARLSALGASRIVHRSDLNAASPSPLESARWAGAVDTVGGSVLASLLRSTAYDGSVAAVGLAGGSELHTTVYPFILRGVNLLGIDTVMASQSRRARAWEIITHDLPLAALDLMTTVAPIEDAMTLSEQLLAGERCGRTVLDLGTTR